MVQHIIEQASDLIAKMEWDSSSTEFLQILFSEKERQSDCHLFERIVLSAITYAGHQRASKVRSHHVWNAGRITGVIPLLTKGSKHQRYLELFEDWSINFEENIDYVALGKYFGFIRCVLDNELNDFDNTAAKDIIAIEEILFQDGRHLPIVIILYCIILYLFFYIFYLLFQFYLFIILFTLKLGFVIMCSNNKK